MTEWLKPQEVAQELKCEYSLVLRLIGSGKLAATDINARVRERTSGKLRPTYRVRREDLEAFLQRGRVPVPVPAMKRERKRGPQPKSYV